MTNVYYTLCKLTQSGHKLHVSFAYRSVRRSGQAEPYTLCLLSHNPAYAKEFDTLRKSEARLLIPFQDDTWCLIM